MLSDVSAACVYLLRAAEAVLKGQVETIVSFHIQNISNKTERNTVPLVGNFFANGGENYENRGLLWEKRIFY